MKYSFLALLYYPLRIEVKQLFPEHLKLFQYLQKSTIILLNKQLHSVYVLPGRHHVRNLRNQLKYAVSAISLQDLQPFYSLLRFPGEGNGTPLQFSYLENLMDGGAWWATVCGVAKSRTRLSDLTFTQSIQPTIYNLSQRSVTHSSILIRKILWTQQLNSNKEKLYKNTVK